MKKITLLAAVILVASFASCKKVRNCKCTDSTDGDTFTVSSGVKLSKKDGKTWCESGNSGSSYTCELQK